VNEHSVLHRIIKFFCVEIVRSNQSIVWKGVSFGINSKRMLSSLFL